MELELAEAWWRLGLLPGEELPTVAYRLLEGGHDGPAICELAALHRPTLRDAAPLFERVLRELGRPVPPFEHAWRTAAKSVAEEVVAGAMGPREGTQRLANLGEATGHPRDLAVFGTLAEDYELLPYLHRSEAAVGQDVLLAARNLARHRRVVGRLTVA